MPRVGFEPATSGCPSQCHTVRPQLLRKPHSFNGATIPAAALASVAQFLARAFFSVAVVSFFRCGGFVFSGWVILALGVGYGVGVPTLKFRLSPQKGAPRVG